MLSERRAVCDDADVSAPCKSACSPWTTSDDVQACAPCGDVDGAVLDDAIAAASDVLFELSGRQFPGSCRDVVRPCGRATFEAHPHDLVIDSANADSPTSFGRPFIACGCNRGRHCGCSTLSEITLGGYPLTSITEIKVADDSNPDWPGTAVLDPARYRIDDYRWLVRLPNPDGSRPGWPCCQALELAAGEPDTFEVTFTYGVGPPPMGVRAANVLACQLALACTGGDGCRLPQRVTSITRQGLTMVLLDPFLFLERGRSGLYEVDLFLATYNPSGIRRRAQIVTPGQPRRVRRVTS